MKIQFASKDEIEAHIPNQREDFDMAMQLIQNTLQHYSNSFNLPWNCKSIKVWKHLSSLHTIVIGSACLTLQMTQISFPSAATTASLLI
jgi:hypothetical protein